MNRDFQQLRRKFVSNDPFMTNGHQILKTAGATRHADRLRSTPDWVTDDSKVRELLLFVFPKMNSSPTQRQRAGRWMQVIQLYYRMGWTEARSAEEIGISLDAFKYYLTAIRRVMKGKTVNNKNRQQKDLSLPMKTGDSLPIETSITREVCLPADVSASQGYPCGSVEN